MSDTEPPLKNALLPAAQALGQIPTGAAREVMLSRLVSEVYRESAPPLRARLLECLLMPVRRLGLAAIAAGAFSIFLHPQRWHAMGVTIDDALRFSAEQVFELARFVDQVQPEAFRQVALLVAEDGGHLPTLTGSLFLLALGTWMPGRAGDESD